MTSFQQVFGYAAQKEEPERTQPHWAEPPHAELGQVPPRVIGRSDRAVVALRHALVYSSGVGLDVLGAARRLSQREARNLLNERHVVRGEEPPDELLRIGVEFADGERASNLGHAHGDPSTERAAPRGPVLTQRGGSGGWSDPALLQQSYWVWPLPPPGPLQIFAEWPALGIELSGGQLDATALLEAAKRSQKLWPE